MGLYDRTVLVMGMAALAFGSELRPRRTEIKFAPFVPSGQTISTGKTKKKEFGKPKLTRKQRKNKTK